MSKQIVATRTAQLIMPGKLTRTAWALPKDMTFAQWTECGRVLRQIEGSVQWWIGDWWRYGVDQKLRKRKEYGTAIEAAAKLGYEVGTCQTYAWVANEIGFSRRLENLSFSHHQEAARASSTAEQDKWLKQAVRKKWSSNELRAALSRQTAVDRTKKTELEAETLGKFAVLYADPPWRYENPPMGGSNRSIENHYPTMELEEICALPVADIAHENSVLFLWATSPKLSECMEVVKAWGFNYRTKMVWVKDKIGMGYHVREQHESLLIVKRGELPPPAVDNRPSSVVEAPRLEHSAKPPIFYDIIDKMYPDVRKIELFARGTLDREWWTTWGNQALAQAAE